MSDCRYCGGPHSPDMPQLACVLVFQDRIAALDAALAEAKRQDEVHWKTRRTLVKEKEELNQALAERTRELGDHRSISRTRLEARDAIIAERTRELKALDEKYEDEREDCGIFQKKCAALERERTEDRAAIRALYAATPEKDNGYYRCRLCGPRQHGAHRLGDVHHESWCPVVRHAAAIQRASEGTP